MALNPELFYGDLSSIGSTKEELTLDLFPKDHPRRRAVDTRNRRLSFLDIHGPYETGRFGYQYEDELRGLRAFFDYVRQLETSNTVLDIGAGRMFAISDFVYYPDKFGSHGLDFHATVLTPLTAYPRNPCKDPEFLFKDKTFLTPAEYLEGIPDESMGGILAVFSIAYSRKPEFAMRRIDEVLVPGGIVKAKFPMKTAGLMIDPERFTAELKRLGYDVAIRTLPTKKDDGNEVVLAKKPGGNAAVSAEEILELDKDLFAQNEARYFAIV